MLIQLNIVCKLLNEEIDQSWLGKVTYSFPTTVAFLDVLGLWSEEKISTVRQLHVVAFPLPLYPTDQNFSYTTHFFDDALPIIPGLRLDLLTVQNIWLKPDGEPLEGWCLDVTYHKISGLLESGGWKEFNYVSGRRGSQHRDSRS